MTNERKMQLLSYGADYLAERTAYLEDQIAELRENLDAKTLEAAMYFNDVTKLRKAHCWIPISDDPPDLPNWVIVYSPAQNGGMPFPGTFDSYFGWLDDLRDSIPAPTHWMPLPLPPEKDWNESINRIMKQHNEAWKGLADSDNHVHGDGAEVK